MSSDAPFLVQMLDETECVSLARFDHPPGAELVDSEEKAAEQYQINIVERGWFRLGYGRHEWTLGPGSVFVSRPGDVYRYSHMRHLDPDACLSLRFTVPSAHEPELARAFNRLQLIIPITNRLAFLRLQVGSHVASDVQMSLDALACDLLDAAGDARNECHRLHRPQQLRWYGSRVNAAREMMEANPADQHSLWNLASRVAMSPFSFARVFRELMGVPPHKYLVRLRLRRARTALESGMSVTDACYAAGFNNLSHFIRSFRAHFGFVPSKLKLRAAANLGSARGDV